MLRLWRGAHKKPGINDTGQTRGEPSYLKKTLNVECMVFGVEYFFFMLRARSAIAGRNAPLRVSFSDQACL
jgi:hypothetical protein